MDIYDTLRDDHEIIRSYLSEIDKLEDTRPATRVKLFAELQVFLNAHARAEEKIVYAELLKHEEAGDLTREGAVEHAVADTLLPVIAGLDPEDPFWRANFSVLKEAVVHHLDEEEKQLFRTARKVLHSDTAAALGPEMDRQREVLLGE